MIVTTEVDDADDNDDDDNNEANHDGAGDDADDNHNDARTTLPPRTTQNCWSPLVLPTWQLRRPAPASNV